ncbi:hypothetical protein Tco_1279208 [Tanacetum coccineum]
MFMCKKVEKGVPLCVEKSDSLDDTDEELYEQELEAHYSFMEKIQEVVTSKSRPTFDAELLDQVDSNVIPDSLGICDNINQADPNAEECWVDGNGSNPSGGFGKLGGGRETRGGRDGLEGHDGQLSMV